MVLIEGKKVIFSSSILLHHKSSAVINNLPEIAPLTLRLSFSENPTGAGSGMQFVAGEPSELQLIIQPNHTYSAYPEMNVLGTRPNGTPIYMQYSQQTMGDASLIHFSLLLDN